MKPLFKSVLVVEDHKMVANGIKLLVGPLFENFQMAYDGAGGMSKALQHFPELAIVDFVLPDTRGDLFVKELKNKIPFIKVLAYTFDYTSDTIVKMIRSGVNGYLLKSGIVVSLRNIRNKRNLLEEQMKNAVHERTIAETEATLIGEERERTRIAQELHDSVMTELLITRLNIANLAIGFPELRQCNEFKNILLQSDSIAEQLRQTSHNMMPAKIVEFGITEAIKKFIANIRFQNLKLSFQSYGNSGLLPGKMEKMLFFIVKELVQNIIKHSYASEALLQLNFYDDGFSLTVEDNGVGIADNHHAGWGLNHIRKEINVLEGKIDIKGSEYMGTTIFIEVPYKITLPALHQHGLKPQA